LDGDRYEGLIWLDSIQTKPTLEEIAEGAIAVASRNVFNTLLEQKTNILAANYSAAQVVNVFFVATFQVAIIGEFFETTIANQVLEAQLSGAADFVATDINGAEYLIRDVPFESWKSFYKQSKSISFNNYIIYKNTLKVINQAETIDELNAIDLDVFPSTQTINLKPIP
jgi:hypothetical protein